MSLHVSAIVYTIRKMSQELSLFDAVSEAQAVDIETTGQGLSYSIVTNESMLEKVLLEARDNVTAMDLETTGFDPYVDAIVGISLSWEEKKACYVPVGHKKGKNVPMESVRKILQPALKEANVIFHNAKFDWKFLRANGIDVDIFADTMLMAYLVDAGQSVALKECSKRYFSETMTYFKELFGKDETHNFSNLLPEEGYLYACADADVTLRLYHYLLPQIEGMDFLRDMDTRLITFLAESELSGIFVEQRALDKMAADAQKEINFLRDTSRDARKLKTFEKIKAVVIDTVKKQMKAATGMIYPNWFQCSMKTACLSARDLFFEETKEEKEYTAFSRFALLVPEENFFSFAIEFKDLESQLFYALFMKNASAFPEKNASGLLSQETTPDMLEKNFSPEGRKRFRQLMDDVQKGNRVKNVFGRWCPLEAFVLTAPENKKIMEALRSYLRATAWDVIRFSVVLAGDAARRLKLNAHFVFAAAERAVFVVHEDEDINVFLEELEKLLNETFAGVVSVPHVVTAGKKFNGHDAVASARLCVKILLKNAPEAEELDALKEWLLAHPGEQNVYLRLAGKTIELGDRYKTQNDPLLFEELQSVVANFGKVIRTVVC